MYQNGLNNRPGEDERQVMKQSHITLKSFSVLKNCTFANDLSESQPEYNFKERIIINATLPEYLPAD